MSLTSPRAITSRVLDFYGDQSAVDPYLRMALPSSRPFDNDIDQSFDVAFSVIE
jgi:hypothetical protein